MLKVDVCDIPYKDPQKRAEYNSRWKKAHADRAKAYIINTVIRRELGLTRKRYRNPPNHLPVDPHYSRNYARSIKLGIRPSEYTQEKWDQYCSDKKATTLVRRKAYAKKMKKQQSDRKKHMLVGV